MPARPLPLAARPLAGLRKLWLWPPTALGRLRCCWPGSGWQLAAGTQQRSPVLLSGQRAVCRSQPSCCCCCPQVMVGAQQFMQRVKPAYLMMEANDEMMFAATRQPASALLAKVCTAAGEVGAILKVS